MVNKYGLDYTIRGGDGRIRTHRTNFKTISKRDDFKYAVHRLGAYDIKIYNRSPGAPRAKGGLAMSYNPFERL